MWFVDYRSTFLRTHPSKNQLRAKPVSLPPIYWANYFSLTPALEKQREHLSLQSGRKGLSFYPGTWRNCPSAQMWKATGSIEERKLLQLWDSTDTFSLTAWVLTPLVPMGPQEEITGNTPWQKTAARLSMAQLWCRTTEGLFTRSFKMHCTSPPSSQFYSFHCQHHNKGEKQEFYNLKK